MTITLKLELLMLPLFAFTWSGTLALTPQQELEVLRKLPPSGYDIRNRPPIPNAHSFMDSSPILTRLLITDIGNINDMKMEYTIQATLQQKWNDKRLNFSVSGRSNNTEHVTITNTEQFWKPEVHVSNARNMHQNQVISHNEFMRVSPNGDVSYSSRIHITLSCPMDLRQFPFHDFICPIRLASQRYSSDDIKLEWNRLDDNQPVEVSASSNFQIFTFLEADASEFSTLKWGENNEESYTCLQAHLTFRRSINYYLIHVYIPCIMMVIISWSAFWLKQEAVTARILVGISVQLVMAHHVANFNAQLPPTPYTKAIDVWTGICLTFTFAALLELVNVNYFNRRDEKGARESGFSSSNLGVEIPLSTISAENINEYESPSTGNVTKSEGKLQRVVQNYMSEFKTVSQKIDGISRILFPSAFLLFVVIYFTYFLCISPTEQSYDLECA